MRSVCVEVPGESLPYRGGQVPGILGAVLWPTAPGRNSQGKMFSREGTDREHFKKVQ